MTDKDREAFEKCAEGQGYRAKKITRPYYGEVYTDEPTHHLWKGWQAARDHYAPKLTAAATLEMALVDISRQFHEPHSQSVATKALRAAGVRFKEEA